jgi:hypothetical protein
MQRQHNTRIELDLRHVASPIESIQMEAIAVLPGLWFF